MSPGLPLTLPARFAAPELRLAHEQLLAARAGNATLDVDGSQVERIDSAAAQWLVLLLTQPEARALLSSARFSEALVRSLALMGLSEEALAVG